MVDKKKTHITIIGSGLAGSFMALLLAKRGYNVAIYEKSSREEISDVASKRSYNIVLFGYGITILKQAGLWEMLKPHMLALKGSVTHISLNTKPVVTLTDEKDHPYFTLSRSLLADILLKKASAHPSVTIHNNYSLLSINRQEKTMVMKNSKTNKISLSNYDVIIGADGANSLVRSFLQQGQMVHHQQEYAQWIYKQFFLSSEMLGKLSLEKKFVHIWTQKKAFIIAHPDENDGLGAMLVFPNEEKITTSSDEIKTFFQINFPELLPAIKEISEMLLSNPDGHFATILTQPWYYKDSIAIIGDAAHGFYPFFGQGTSAAFSDSIELCNLIDTYGSNWGEIFPLYQEMRKKNTDALAELSKEALTKNLRFKKADYDAIYDKLQTVAYALFPKIIYPPLSETITSDPEHAAEHRYHYYKQRKLANKLGLSVLVKGLEKTLSISEKSVKIKK